MIYDVQELTLLLYFTVCSQRIYRNFEFVVCMSLLCREEYRTKELKKQVNQCMLLYTLHQCIPRLLLRITIFLSQYQYVSIQTQDIPMPTSLSSSSNT